MLLFWISADNLAASPRFLKIGWDFAVHCVKRKQIYLISLFLQSMPSIIANSADS